MTGTSLEKSVEQGSALKRGTVVAHISTANKVPSKLAPRIVRKAFPVNAFSSVLLDAEVEIEKELIHLDIPQGCTHPTLERLDRLFGKLDLTGAQGWTDKERQEIKDLLMEYHDLFALGDLELGKPPQ